MTNDTNLVGPLARGLTILDLLRFESLSTDQIAQLTRIPKTSTFRLLNTLEAYGLVERKTIDRIDTWNLGLQVLVIAQSKLSRMDTRMEIRDILQDLAETTDQVVQLGVLYQDEVMYIDMIRRQKPLSVYAEVGARLPINISAAGMVLTAYRPEKEQRMILNRQDFPRNTDHTPTEPSQIKHQLALIRENGYALDDQGYAVGIRCIAAPVFNHQGEVVASINITGPISAINDQNLPQYIAHVKAAAEESSRRLGYDQKTSESRDDSTPLTLFSLGGEEKLQE